jgi:hypothetical protein
MNALLPLPALDQIHAHPELAYEQHATAELVAERLARRLHGAQRQLRLQRPRAVHWRQLLGAPGRGLPEEGLMQGAGARALPSEIEGYL